MNSSSTNNKVQGRQSNPPKPPRLEKLALDADTNPEFGVLLRAVGFDVVDVRHAAIADVDLRSDPSVLRWARKNKRILVCHDKHKGRNPIMLELAEELYYRGGRILQVSGGSGQNPLEALAKVLRYRSEWLAFFSGAGKGRVVVTADRCSATTARTLYTNFQYALMKVPSPEALTELRPLTRPRRRRPQVAPASLLLPEGPAKSNEEDPGGHTPSAASQ